MAINLKKGQSIDLRKGNDGLEFDLSSVTIGLGWDVRKKDGLFGRLFGGRSSDFDLDAIAFLLDQQGKVANRGRTVVSNSGQQVGLYEGDVVFFNSMRHPSGHVWLTGDNRTGAGDGDDEQVIVKLNSLDQKYKKILFVVSIYQGRTKSQNFSMLDNAFIRAVDARGKEIAKYLLSGDSTLNGMCTMVFAEVYREGHDWKFKALGQPAPTDNFVDILKSYI